MYLNLELTTIIYNLCSVANIIFILKSYSRNQHLKHMTGITIELKRY